MSNNKHKFLVVQNKRMLEFQIPEGGNKVRKPKWFIDMMLKVSDRVYVGKDSRSLPYYIFTCYEDPDHGYQLDYPHGYDDRLDCSICLFNRWVKQKTESESQSLKEH